MSLKIDWFDLLAVQGTLRSLLQHRSQKASILQHSTFFTVQLSQPYMTTGKTIPFTIWTFCWAPAPVDPGNSKRGRRWRGKTYLFNIRLD